MKLHNIPKFAIISIYTLFSYSSYGKCLSSWQYYMPVTITSNVSSSLYDYQVKITVNTAALISAGKMSSTGNDIRFINASSCNSLHYWIESGINTSATIIWVKLPALGGSANTTINMYYGNTNAPAASNGDSTFIVFDDFNGSSLNTSKWSITTSGSNASVLVTGGNLVCSTTAEANIRSLSSFSSPLIEECNITAVTGSWESMAIVNSGTDDGYGLWLGDYDYATGSNGPYHMWTGWTFTPNNPNCNYYTGHFTDSVMLKEAVTGIWQLEWPSSNVQKMSWPGGSFSTSNSAKTLGSSVQIAVGNMCGAYGSMSVDWIRARSYASVEPSVSLGTETANHNSGIETESFMDDISIFPNPAHNQMYIELSKSENSFENLQLLDVNGKLIQSIQINEDRGIFDFNTMNCPRGVYFIRIVGSKYAEIQKVVLE